MKPESFDLDDFICRALDEDRGDGDHTSLACVPSSVQRKAKLLVKEPGILAGMHVAKLVFFHVDPELEVEELLKDGDEVKPGDIAFYVSGSAQSILQAERLVLNIMQRMSGIASMTHRVSKSISHTHTKLLDTRKTTPNMRYLEKWAVRIGGGVNHRFGLYDMVMIKDNHIDYAGSIADAMERVKVYLKKMRIEIPIEVEARNMDEVKEILAAGGADRIMLDNFTPEEVADAVKFIDGRAETEASGGITPDTIKPYAEAGVDFISMGALTHSVKSLDLSLKAVED